MPAFLLLCIRDVLTGSLPSQACARWVARHGIGTSFTHGSYAFGELLTGLLTLPLSDGAGATDGAPAEAATAAGDRPPSPPCGQSFTAATPVLLASGKTEPISKLHPGQKVFATSTRTGKNQPETVTAVLLHHDTDLYDLKVREHGHTTVIHTTSSHLFWVPGSHGHGRWVKAAALRHGTRLRAPGGDGAVVAGGWIPRHHDGWMWDLTVPGNNDHDFYVAVGQTFTLVHNTGDCLDQAKALVDAFKKNPQGGGVRPGRSMAGATWDINGVAGQGVTVSGKAVRPGTLTMPTNRIFTATRDYEAEQKMLEYIAQGLPTNSTGTVNLYIKPGITVNPDVPICPSCQGVISQFEQRFPGIKLNYFADSPG